MRNIIPKSELKAGYWYKGQCRNATRALWTGEEFLYFRCKFGDYFSESILHPEDDTPYDTFRPYEELEHNSI